MVLKVGELVQYNNKEHLLAQKCGWHNKGVDFKNKTRQNSKFRASLLCGKNGRGLNCQNSIIWYNLRVFVHWAVRESGRM